MMRSLFTKIHCAFALAFILLFGIMGGHKKLADAGGLPMGIDPTLALFIALFVTLSVLYWQLLRSLGPLEKLKERIVGMRGEGQAHQQSQSDEVSEILCEFEKTESALNAMLRAREVFLRTILHELNSPLGKARIVVGLLDEGKQKERLVRICVELEQTIGDFVKIERILSKKEILAPGAFSLSAMIESFVLGEEEGAIGIEGARDVVLFADRELFAFALKNLIRNALRYKTDGRVGVWIDEHSIAITNKGNPLPAKAQELFCPYHAREAERYGEGLGLGLYIAWTIIDLHGMRLSHTYSQGEHRFLIDFGIQNDQALSSPSSH